MKDPPSCLSVLNSIIRVKLLRFVLVLGLAAIAVRGEEPSSGYSIATDFTYTSKYYFRGVKSQDSALQPSLTLTKGNASIGIWSSQALEHRSATWADGNEIDVSASYTHPIDKDYSLTFGGNLYTYPSARASLDELKHTTEFSLSLAGPVGPLSAELAVYRDIDYKSNTLQLDLSYSFALPNEKGSFDVGGYVGTTDIGDYNAGLAGTGGYNYRYYGLDASLSYKLGDHSTVKVGVHWTDVARLPSPSDNVWFSIGVGSEF